MHIYDKNPEAQNYRELKIGIIGDSNEEVPHNLKTSTAIWMGAIEEELFRISNF